MAEYKEGEFDEILAMNIHQRLHAVREKVVCVKQRKVNGVNFPVTDYDEVVKLVRPWFQHYRIGLHTSLICINQGMCKKTGGELGRERTEAEFGVVFTNIDNPDDLIHSIQPGYGVDGTDKGPGMASTYATKLAILKACLFQTGMDPDLQALNAAPDPAPPELAEVTKQAKDGRSALVESVQKWLVMKDEAVRKRTAKELIAALNEMVVVYFGPSGWFGKYLAAEYPEKLVVGNINATIENLSKIGVVRIFLKYRLRILDMAEFNKYDYATVMSHIRGFYGMKVDVDIYSMAEGEFSKMVGLLHDELKG